MTDLSHVSCTFHHATRLLKDAKLIPFHLSSITCKTHESVFPASSTFLVCVCDVAISSFELALQDTPAGLDDAEGTLSGCWRTCLPCCLHHRCIDVRVAHLSHRSNALEAAATLGSDTVRTEEPRRSHVGSIHPCAATSSGSIRRSVRRFRRHEVRCAWQTGMGRCRKRCFATQRRACLVERGSCSNTADMACSGSHWRWRVGQRWDTTLQNVDFGCC